MSGGGPAHGARPGQVQGPYRLPAGATEVLLVRHGSILDAPRGSTHPLLDGRDDPPLSDLGREQARALAARLQDKPFAALFATPLRRTLETGAPLAAATGHEPVIVPELIEMLIGEWDGQEYRARALAGDPVIARGFQDESWDRLPGAERGAAFAARVHAGLDLVADATGPDRVAVVMAHTAVIAEVCHHITRSRPFAFLHVENTSITRVVRARDGRWTLHGFNDVAHLPRAAGAASANDRPGQIDGRYRRPAGATEIVVARHGASLSTPEPLHTLPDGHDDPPLSPDGEQQALALGERLAGTDLDRVFVTSLRRTAQTAAPLAQRTGLRPEEVAELVEVHLGDWEGQAYRDRTAADDPVMRRVFADERWDHIPGSEPVEDFRARVGRGVDAVVHSTGPDATALIVVHGGVIAELCRLATQCTPFACLNVDNGSITRIVLGADGRWTMRGFNDIAHLPGG